ncbi:MAG: GNAT family N-acetyltransferase [Planctomycetes bacterium]|nr:GNAT family N-acetyltransferase [Planctomycetota bacterium]
MSENQSDQKQKPQLRMKRPHLQNLPLSQVAPGYYIRTYRDGDSGNWQVILAQSFDRDPDSFSFDKMMRRDPAFRPERIFFVCQDEEPVGTVSAWRRPAVDPEAGIIHWLGVMPGHGGKALGRSLVTEALQSMAEDELKRAFLLTDDFRLPALKTYLNCGFEPQLVHENQRDRWKKVFQQLRMPELSEEFAEILDGPLWEKPDLPSDEFDYDNFVKTRFRWHPERSPGRPSSIECDAFADEGLYAPADLGKAGCTIESVKAGENKHFSLWFEVGPGGLERGTNLIFGVLGQCPLGTGIQTDRPDRPGFVEVEEAPADKKVEVTGSGFRVEDQPLSEGDSVRLTIGREGGFKWTPLAGVKAMKVIVQGPGEHQRRLPEPVTVTVTPHEADHVDVFLPGTARQGKDIVGRVAVRDRFDNRCPSEDDIDISFGGKSYTIHLQKGIGKLGEHFAGDNAIRAEVTDGPCGPGAMSNPCVPAAVHNLYFGDLHCHDFTCPAEGWTEEVYRWAIEDKRLDFLSVPVQNHAHLDNEKWTIAKHMAEVFLDEGRFVTFPAFEWQHSHYGDKVVHYLGGSMPYLPVDDPRSDHPAKLYETLRRTDAFIISHHPGYELDLHVPGTDWEAVETDVDRLVEIWSMHGSSEGFNPNDRPLVSPRRPDGVMEALRRGLRMGIVGGSDSHGGRPGGSAKEPRQYWGGLCGVWAEKLTRRSLFDALMARRTYALTGDRIVLRFAVNGEPMGSELPPTDGRKIEIEVWGTDTIESVQLLRNGTVIEENAPGSDTFELEYEEKRAETRADFYHCRITQQNGGMAVCSPVWVG